MSDFVLFYIDNPERYQFFSRFFTALKSLGYAPAVITGSPSVYLKSRIKGVRAYLLHNAKRGRTVCVSKNWGSFHDVIVGNQSVVMAEEIFELVCSQVDDFISSMRIKKCIIFNGSSTVALAIAENISLSCKGVEIVYFELANLPGKMFIDTKGVNAKSSLYENIRILDGLEADYEEYEAWRLAFLEGSNTPKQSFLAGKFWYEYVVDWVGFVFSNALDQSQKSFVSRFLRKVERKPSLNLESFTPERPYLFFPCQVSGDTQLTLNSDIDNLEGIRIANDLAEKLSLELVVKLHPAEVSSQHVSQICSLVESCGGRLLNNGDALSLVRDAQKVVTINSSVGLLAIILGKDVDFLGRTYFSYLTQENLPSYINHYLIDVDYFSNDIVSVDTVKRILI